jgi:hypothetical protein
MLNNLGGIHHELGDEEKALDYHRHALTIRQEIGDQRGKRNHSTIPGQPIRLEAPTST